MILAVEVTAFDIFEILESLSKTSFEEGDFQPGKGLVFTDQGKKKIKRLSKGSMIGADSLPKVIAKVVDVLGVASEHAEDPSEKKKLYNMKNYIHLKLEALTLYGDIKRDIQRVEYLLDGITSHMPSLVGVLASKRSAGHIKTNS